MAERHGANIKTGMKEKDGTTNYTIVAMASLIQLKDKNGNNIQKWMGVYHDVNYVNYKTYLTFDESGNEQWVRSGTLSE